MRFFIVKVLLIAWLLNMTNNFLETNYINEIPFDELKNTIISECDIEGMSIADNLKIKEFYGINADDYEGCELYIADDTMDVREIFILKANENEDTQLVEKAIQKRIEKQYNIFEGYGREQIKLINDSVIHNEGKYVFFIISNDSEYIGDIFYQKIKE